MGRNTSAILGKMSWCAHPVLCGNQPGLCRRRAELPVPGLCVLHPGSGYRIQQVRNIFLTVSCVGGLSRIVYYNGIWYIIIHVMALFYLFNYFIFMYCYDEMR